MRYEERQRNDRNRIALGPAPADARRNAARVQTDIDLVNTNIDLGNIGGGGGITENQVQDLINAYTPVTGGTGYVVGLPVGTPYIYVSPTMASFPIDISGASLDLAKSSSVGYFAEVDTQDATGLGADTVCMIGSGSGASAKLIGFNPSVGTASSIGLAEQPQAFVRFGTDRLICEVANATTPRFHWINNGVLQSYTPAIPATGWRIVGVGPAANGTDVLVVWAKRITTSGTSNFDVYIRTYNTSGTLVSSQTTTSFVYDQSANQRARVDNGYIVFYNSNGAIYTKAADTTSAWSYIGAYAANVAEQGQITSSGHAFAKSGADLLRINCTNGSVAVYPNTFVNDEGTVQGIYSISSTKAVVTGRTASGGDPFIDTIVLSGGSANVTQTVIASTTLAFCFQPVAVPSGNVVFGVQGDDSITGAYELLLSIAGP